MYHGDERRMNSDERLGFIEAKVESVQEQLKEFKHDHKEHITKEEAHQERMYAKLDKIQTRQNEIHTDLTVYKRLFKVVIAGAGFVLAASAGDAIKFLGKFL